MRTVGIIGGLGPLAGAYFYRRLIELTPAADDGDHLPVILLSSPAVPSRIAHLENRGPSPVPSLVQAARALEQAGADFLVMPSSTTHAYYPDLSQAISLPWLNMLDAVSQATAAQGIARLGILATTPTVQYRLYDPYLLPLGIAPVYPDPRSQSEIMAIIGRVKSGGDPATLGLSLLEIAERPWADRVPALLLACTEIPVIFPQSQWRRQAALFSATDILALRTIAWARKP